MILNLLTLVFAVRASYSNVYNPGMMNGGIQTQPGMQTQPTMTGATAMQQAGMNGMMASFTLARPNSYCKNHRMTSSGELLQGETIVLSNPLRSIQSCYTAVMQARTVGCGTTFVANNAGECACLRVGIKCRYEESKTGLGVYQLSGFLQKAHEKTETKEEAENVDEPVLKSPKVMPVAGTVPMAGAYNPMYPNAMQTGILGRPSYQQMNVNRGCDNEVEDSTDGQPPVLQLGASTNADQCAVAVQSQQRMGLCGDMFMFTPTTMGCSCIRAGQFCDDESMPGTTLFKSNTATGMVPGMAGTAGMVPGVNGMATMPGATVGMVPGMTPGMTTMNGMGTVGTAGMVPGMTTGMRPGMTNMGTMNGMGTTGMVPGMAPGMATPGMTPGYGRTGTGMMTPGATAMTPGYGRTTGMMTPGVAGYPHVLSQTRTEEILCGNVQDKPSCEQHGCMWAGEACAEFTMQEEGEALSEKVLFYVVVPITLVCVTLALICGARRCAKGTTSSSRPEALLMENCNDHVVPVV